MTPPSSQPQPTGNPPLWSAAASGRTEDVKRLLEGGADPNCMNAAGTTPLMVAAHGGHLEIMRLLIAKGANIDFIIPTLGTCALFQAMAWCDHEGIRALTEAGANVNITEPGGWTALMRAASGIDTPMIRYLIAKGANIRAKNDSGQTALDIYKRNRSLVSNDAEILHLLGEQGDGPHNGGTVVLAGRRRLRTLADTDGKGNCGHCGHKFRYLLIHNGFNDSAYAYCEQCGETALLNDYQMPPHIKINIFRCIESEDERFLKPCGCGGRFKRDAAPRCPKCKTPLSAIDATAWIEANSSGVAAGWRWQKNWKGSYCIVIEDRIVENNWIVAENAG